MLDVMLSPAALEIIRSEIFEIHKDVIKEILNETKISPKRYYKKNELAKFLRKHPSWIDFLEEAGLRYVPSGENAKEYDILEVYDVMESLKVSKY